MVTGQESERWTNKYPELGTGPVPVGPCIDPEYFEREREKIFGSVWLNVGRVEEIPGPGDYIVKELDVCRSSVLVVRGRDGVVRGFHNVCKHRGNRLARQCAGSARAFVCGFHGWTYSLSGDLLHVPDEEQFFGLRKAEYGMAPVATDVWEGFIFVNLAREPAQSLRSYLGELGESLAGYPFNRMSLGGHYRAEVNANWKVTLNSFQEGYHVAFLHRKSAGRAYASKASPVTHALEFRLYDLHRMMSIPGADAYVPTPVEIVAHQFGTSITNVAGKEEETTSRPPGLNQSRSPNWVFDMIIFFPNFFMFLFDGTYFTYNFWPLSLDRTLWETRTYYPQARNAGQRFSQEYAKCALRDTLREDGNTLEAIQSNLASGAISNFVLQDQEILIRHSHKVVENLLNK
jgi:phenylpropionate dioxygenase-like ring-hydroxylating dioxygenase large terminal subunit